MNENRPKAGWRQKSCKTFYFIPTRWCTCSFFLVLAVANIGLGVFLLIKSGEIDEVRKRYDDIAGCESPDAFSANSNTCSFTVDLDMDGPVYVHYLLTGFYQNHRKYVKSKSLEQLSGEDLSVSQLDLCEPIVTIEDLNSISNVQISTVPNTLDNNDPAFPCGLIPLSIFQDSFVVNGDSTLIDNSDIQWTSDEDRYKNLDDMAEKQWLDVETGEFAVWMRVAPTNKVKKLIGKIDQDLSGTVPVSVTVGTDLSDFDGEKWLIFTTTNEFGGKNNVLGGSFIISGLLSMFWAFLLVVKPHSGRVKPGEDEEYLDSPY